MKTLVTYQKAKGTEEKLAKLLASRLGARLAQCRHERGWTQAQLAEKLDVETETVSRFERGHAMPSLKRLAYLAEILDAPIADLLGVINTSPSEISKELVTLLRPLNDKQREALLTAVRAMTVAMATP